MVSHSKLVVATVATSTLLVFRPDATDAFVANVRPHYAVGPFAVKRPNAAPVLRMAGEYDSLEEKLFKAAAPAPKPPPAFKPAEPAPSPVPAPPVKLELPSDLAPPAPAPEPVTTTVEVAVPAPAPAPAPPVESAAAASIALPDDIPIVPVAAGAFALFAGASFAMRSGKDEREEAQSGGASASSGTDLSIPYDAAARLAYDASDKKMDYASFRSKYEADAVADVKRKTSGDAGDDAPADEDDLSIPYDAAARYAYEHSNKKMDYAAFKTKYEADAVADVKKKAKK